MSPRNLKPFPRAFTVASRNQRETAGSLETIRASCRRDYAPNHSTIARGLNSSSRITSASCSPSIRYRSRHPAAWKTPPALWIKVGEGAANASADRKSPALRRPGMKRRSNVTCVFRYWELCRIGNDPDRDWRDGSRQQAPQAGLADSDKIDVASITRVRQVS